MWNKVDYMKISFQAFSIIFRCHWFCMCYIKITFISGLITSTQNRKVGANHDLSGDTALMFIFHTWVRNRIWVWKKTQGPGAQRCSGMIIYFIQSISVITQSSIVRYCINIYRHWGRISIRCWIHKTHSISRPNEQAMGVYCEYLRQNWQRYNGTGLYLFK